MALATSTAVISRNLSFSARTLVTACTARPPSLPAGGVPARRRAGRAGPRGPAGACESAGACRSAGACGPVGPCCRPPAPDVNVCPPPPGPCLPNCKAGPCDLCAPPCPCPPTNRPCGPHCIKAQGQPCPPKSVSTPTPTPAAVPGAAGSGPVRRSVSCTQVAGARRHLGSLPPPPRAESVTLIQQRRSSDKAHDAGCPCPTPCGPCGCPKGCGCLPPPCNLPPKCIQYMTGYYYYPYGTWFAGPYHVQGICQPVGKDTLGCDEQSKGAPPPPCSSKDSKDSSNSLLDYCKKIKKQCAPAKADCSKPTSLCSPTKPPAGPKPACSPPKPTCPPKSPSKPTQPSCPPKTCQSKPAVPLTCFRSSKPRDCSLSKPPVTCPPSKATSLTEICKSTKKPVPPSPPLSSSPKSSCGAKKTSAPPCPPRASCSAPVLKSSAVVSTSGKAAGSCAPPAQLRRAQITKPLSFTEIFSSRDKPAQGAPKVKNESTTPNIDKMPKSIFNFYLKTPQT